MWAWVRPLLVAVAGLALGGTLLWLVARKIDWTEAGALLRQTDYWWIALGQTLYALDIAWRVARWHRLLGSAASRLDTAVALVVGYAVNNLVPARLGELVRADLLKRRANVARATALGSIVIERAIDLLIVLAMFVAGMAAMQGRSEEISRVFWIALIVTVVALLCVAAVVRHAHAILDRLTNRNDGRLQRILRHLRGRFVDFAGSMRVLSTRNFAAAAIYSAPIAILECAAIWCVCRAVGIELTLGAAVLLMAAGSLSTLLPSAPGFFGSYQLAYVLALGAWGVAATPAAVAATTVIIYLIGGLTLAGGIAWLVFMVRPADIARRGRANVG